MKCKVYNCPNEASQGFPACSITHGVKYKAERDQLVSYQNLHLKNLYYHLLDYYEMQNWPVDKVIHYSQFI